MHLWYFNTVPTACLSIIYHNFLLVFLALTLRPGAISFPVHIFKWRFQSKGISKFSVWSLQNQWFCALMWCYDLLKLYMPSGFHGREGRCLQVHNVSWFKRGQSIGYLWIILLTRIRRKDSFCYMKPVYFCTRKLLGEGDVCCQYAQRTQIW